MRGRRLNRADISAQREQMILEVLALAGLLGRSPRQPEYREYYGKLPQFQLRFGNWGNLLRAAGLEPIPVGTPGWRYVWSPAA